MENISLEENRKIEFSDIIKWQEDFLRSSKEGMQSLKDEVMIGISKAPELTAEGLEHTNIGTKKFLEERNELLSEENLIAHWHCCRFIDGWLLYRKTFNRNISSYALKHTCEHHIEAVTKEHVYVSNGVFIAAMLTEGFNYKRCNGYTGTNLNAFFNISLKQLKAERNF